MGIQISTGRDQMRHYNQFMDQWGKRDQRYRLFQKFLAQEQSKGRSKLKKDGGASSQHAATKKTVRRGKETTKTLQGNEAGQQKMAGKVEINTRGPRKIVKEEKKKINQNENLRKYPEVSQTNFQVKVAWGWKNEPSHIKYMGITTDLNESGDYEPYTVTPVEEFDPDPTLRDIQTLFTDV